MGFLKIGLIGGALSLWLIFPAVAQSVQLFGIEPTIGVEGKLNKGLGYFFQIACENQLNYERLADEVFEDGFRNIDYQVGLTSDITTDLSGSANLTFRIREPFGGSVTTEIRPVQQLTLATYFLKYRFRQRVRADERFIRQKSGNQYEFDLRLRYRLSLDFPLAGDRLDVREFYLNTNVEFLYTPTAEDAFFYRQYRGYAGVGYQFSERYTLEIGGALESVRITRELGRENNWLLKIVCAIQI